MAEMVMQQLLMDAGAKDVSPDLVTVEPRGLEVAADWQTLRSPETYLGYGQSTGFASDGGAAFDTPHAYAAHPRLPLNYWDLSGTWTVARHAAILNEPGGRIAFQFQARDVNLVMGPASSGGSIPFRVYLDGQVASGAHGTDVQTDGSGDRQRTAHLPADPPIGSDRRAPLRDRVSRRGRRGLLLHVRLRRSRLDGSHARDTDLWRRLNGANCVATRPRFRSSSPTRSGRRPTRRHTAAVSRATSPTSAEFEASGLGRRDDARWSGALEIIPTKADVVLDLIRMNSLWPLLSGLACCAIEMISAATSKNDMDRLGMFPFRASPRQADVLIVAGTCTTKMAGPLIRLWDQMPEPKWCIALGDCTCSGGRYKRSYSTIEGIDRIMPVDVYIPGCPPRPEASSTG